jgi:glucuronosyltransferase
MPVKTLQLFLDTFKKLPYGIIWKWEEETIADLPANVMIRKWLPQSDILADSHVKVFMTHGGLFGTQEAIHRARPMVLFPCYGDQHRNSYKLQRAGVGRVLNIVNLTASELESTILEVATNPVYRENIEKMSMLFRDNPTDPLEETIYWIEYVIRHNGAKHLRSASRDLPWYQYLLLDILAIALAIIFIFVVAVKRLVKMCRKSEQKKHFKQE